MFLNVSLVNTGKCQPFEISGFVFDQETDLPLSGANIVLDPGSQVTITDTAGHFSIQTMDSTVILKVSYVGYKSEITRLIINGNVNINIELKPGKELPELVIRGSQFREPFQKSNSIVMPLDKIKSLPMIFGEPDILKALQLLPGVQSGEEGTAGIYVRGGGQDQNLVLLDNIPLYNVTHLFGLFSSFNPGILDRMELFTGGFPARYGGRLSSVIDIKSKDGDYQHFHGEGSLGLIASNLTVSGPIKKDKISFIAGFRRSYLDLFTVPISRLIARKNEVFGYYIQDFNSKLNWAMTTKQNLYVSIYHSIDYGFLKYKYHSSEPQSFLEYIDISKMNLQWGNFVVSSGINSRWSEKLQSNLTFAYNRYKYQLSRFNQNIAVYHNTEIITSEDNFVNHSGVNDLLFLSSSLFRLNETHLLRFGMGMTIHYFLPDYLDFNSINSEGYHYQTGGIHSLEGNAYVEDEIILGKFSKLNLGIHASSFRVNDKYYGYLQPRISSDIFIGKGWRINASYSHMAQYLHLLTNSGLPLPTDLWVPATDRVKPQSGYQLSAGFLKDFKGSYSFSIQGYYKKMKNLIEYKEGALIYGRTEEWQDIIVKGNGFAYGMEFLCQKKTGRITGWAGYSLSRSLRQFDELNNGKIFPYKYDRIHDVSITGNYKVNNKIEISANWQFATGIAFTQPLYLYPANTQFINIEDNYYGNTSIIKYSSRNASRYPDFHRLDLNIKFIKEKKWGERAWVISLINAYNRKNPFFLEIDTQNTETAEYHRLIKYSFIQIVPSLSYQFRFN